MDGLKAQRRELLFPSRIGFDMRQAKAAASALGTGEKFDRTGIDACQRSDFCMDHAFDSAPGLIECGSFSDWEQFEGRMHRDIPKSIWQIYSSFNRVSATSIP